MRDSSLSHSTRRRIHHRFAVAKQVNKAVLALNSLYHGTDVGWNKTFVNDLSLLPLVQQDALRHITKMVDRLGPPPLEARSQGAMNALQVAGSSYSEPHPDVGSVVAMELDRLSLPSGKVASVDLGDHLKGEVHSMVDDFENFLLQDASVWSDLEVEASKIKTYNDPLLGSRTGYISFLRHLYKSGVLSFTDTCRGRVGAFCVSKKPKYVDGKRVERQRLVLDCRAVNLQFREPPRTELGSLASLAEVTIPEGEQLYIATSDICDCFYACGCPPGLEQFFCLHEDVSWDEVCDITEGKFDGSSLQSSRICPCISVLPMGFNWSFYLVQVLHEQAALQALGQSRDSVFLDAHPSPVLSSQQCCSMPYCDNVHVLSLNPELCQQGKDLVVSKLESMGFTMHEHTSASTLTQTLGGIVDGSVGEVRATSLRMWSLIYAFEYIACHVVSTELVQRLLGHAMCVCCHNRAGMCIFRRLYDYVHSGSPPRRLTHSEQLECKIFSGIIPLLVADLRRPWSDVISASDASPTGWGICEHQSSSRIAQQHGAWQERWRYRRLDPSEWRPRERAMGRCVFTDVRTARGSLHEVDDVDNYTRNEDFPEIPKDLLQPELWKTVNMGTWHDQREHITLKEARALLMVTRRLSRAQHHRNKKHLVLLDNMALCFAAAKGRSAKYDMLRVLQKIGSICLACCISIRTRWVPSELNIADGPSRGQYRPGALSSKSFGPGFETQNLKSCSWKQGDSCQGVNEGPEASGQASCEVSEGSQEGGSFAKGDHETEGPCSPKECSESASSCPGARCWSLGPTEEDDCPREKGGEQRSSESICPIPVEVRGLLQGQRVPLSIRAQRHRPSSSGLHGHFVHGRSIPPRRRKDLCCSRIPFSGGERASSSNSSLLEGLAEDNASSEPPSNAEAGSLWCSNDFGGAWKAEHGIDDTDRFLALPSSRGGHRSQGQEHHSPSSGSWRPVQVGDCGHQGSREPKARQDRGVRQQLGNRPHHLGRCSPSQPLKESQEQRGVDIPVQHGGIQKAILFGKCNPEPWKPSSVPAKAWRSNRGFVLQEERVQCCEGTRPVEDRHECQAIHQSGKSSRAVESPVKLSPQVLPVVGEKSPSCVSGQPASQDAGLGTASVDVFTTSSRPRRFCLEIFAGTARITSALQRVGILTYPIDIDIFPSHNVLDPTVAHTILNWISGNRVKLVWLGMPCTTFSRARRDDGVGPLPLRDSGHLWGLPYLKRHDLAKLVDGNRLFQFTMKVLHLCQQHSVPYVLENPLTSMAWEMPPLVKFSKVYSPHVCDLDFCCYGECWRKPTRLLYNFMDLSSLARRCSGTFLKCSNTKRPHVPLTGKDANGIYMTRRAQPYPLPLTSEFAHIAAQLLLGPGSGLH